MVSRANLSTPLVFAVALLGVMMTGGQARAGEVCNETSYMLDLAIAWRTPAGLAVEGWTRLRPGTCETTPLDENTDQFIYARSTEAYLGGVREWRGGLEACVDEIDFSFEGVADCAPLGLTSKHFRRLNAAERVRTTLVEPDDFGSRAGEAGLQRLLQAAGYDIRLIDGYAGRRTRQQIDTFERDVETDFGDDRAALIDALHERAALRNATAGLQICNESGDVVAAAIARPMGTRWESRGWWHIAPGGCVRPVAARLTAGEGFFFAQQLDTRNGSLVMRPLTAGEQSFCIGPARFLAEGRQDCAARSYTEAMFRPAPTPEDGASRVTLTDRDFDETLQ